MVAVSGGADSVALLDVLCALRESLALTLTVVHVHHGLRPEADAEADGVRRLAESLGVPCRVERVTVRRASPWDGLEAEAGAPVTPRSSAWPGRSVPRASPPATPPTTRPRPC